MPKTVRNVYDKEVSFEKLLEAHRKARRGKREKRKVILLELVLEEQLLQLEKDLKNCTYKHSKYTKFKIYQTKERVIMASEYIDRIVHQWYVQNFIKPYFVPQFINTTYACIEGRGMHKASKDVQKAMRSARTKWQNYYIVKMDITKYFHNIDKRILWDILKRKIKEIIMVNTRNITFNRRNVRITSWKLYISNVCKYLFKRIRSICKTYIKMQILL